MNTVLTTSSIPTLPMANPTGLERVWLDFDARAHAWGRPQSLGGCQSINQASARAARVRPIPNSA